MFKNCSALEKVDGLSAKGLSASALAGMFLSCNSLTSVQDLYIDNSEDKNATMSKCESMFQNCNSLLSVGGLIKGLKGQRQLKYMFRNCTSLKDASKLSIEINPGQ